MFSLNPMNWFKSSESKSLDVGTVPGYYGSCGQSGSFIDFLQANQNFDLSFYMMIRYYEQCGPLADAIDKVAQEVATITPQVWDRQEEKFIDHPIDDLLSYPHADISREEFLFAVCALYLLTGNIFPYVTLSTRNIPLELNYYSPQHITLENSTNDGFLESIQLYNYGGSDVFNRIEDFRRFRYVNSDDSAEVWPIRRFNPRRSTNHLFGLSPINSIFYEIEQYIASSKHNLSLLKRGARPGGVFSTTSEIPLSDEQFERMQNQIDKYYVGENNAGRPLLMENTKYEESIVNNKDMDYGTMRKNIQAMIYNRLNIPLPSISGENMTLANMDVAKLNLYDNAVIPVTKVIFGQIGRFLFPRFETTSAGRRNAERYELRFDEGKIPALQLRRNEVVKIRKDVGVNTQNELRAYLGDEPIVGGDIIYVASGMVPVGIDEEDPRLNQDNPNDDNTTPPPVNEQGESSPEGETETRSNARDMFVKQMKVQVNNEGQRLYSDDEIEAKANSYGL